MSNQRLRERFCQIIAAAGSGLAKDPARLRAVLADAFGAESKSCRKEILALTLACEEKISEDLCDALQAGPAAIALGRLARRLHDERGLDLDLADWAVGSWAVALNLISEADLPVRKAPVPAVAPGATSTTMPPTPPPRAVALHPPSPARAVSIPTTPGGAPCPGCVASKKSILKARVAAVVAYGLALGSLHQFGGTARRDGVPKDPKSVQTRSPTAPPSPPRSDPRVARADALVNETISALIPEQSRSQTGELTAKESNTEIERQRPKLREAKYLIEQALIQTPHDEHAWELKARVLYYLADYRASLSCIDEARRLFPQNQDLQTLRVRAETLRQQEAKGTRRAEP